MTKHEAAVISAYTGFLIGEFSAMHAYAEKTLGRPVFTHQLADENLQKELRLKSKPDFLKIHAELTE